MMACVTACVILILQLKNYLNDRLVNPLRFEEGRYVCYTQCCHFLDRFCSNHTCFAPETLECKRMMIFARYIEKYHCTTYVCLYKVQEITIGSIGELISDVSFKWSFTHLTYCFSISMFGTFFILVWFDFWLFFLVCLRFVPNGDSVLLVASKLRLILYWIDHVPLIIKFKTKKLNEVEHSAL